MKSLPQERESGHPDVKNRERLPLIKFNLYEVVGSAIQRVLFVYRIL